MARKKICVICGMPIENDSEAVPYKGRHAHRECFNRTIRLVTNEQTKKLQDKKKQTPKKTKPQKELKAGLSETEYKEKVALMDLIREIQGTEKLTAKTYALIEKLYQEKYSYEDIKKAVHWRYKIAVDDRKWARSEDIAAGLRYYIDEALGYYKRIEKTHIYNSSLLNNVKDLYRERTVRIGKPSVSPPQIDIEKIGE
ncbi:MAG: hypothetical protein KH031_24010 [Clostridiales bacterium]|nr:hypothetical protein [Clostridiales bacterium]